jgi:hypothetical protein
MRSSIAESFSLAEYTFIKRGRFPVELPTVPMLEPESARNEKRKILPV